MCDPATIATGLMSAFSAVSDYSAQSSATAATNQQRLATQERSRKEATAAAKANNEAVMRGQMQENDASVKEQIIASRETVGARASAVASAAENGVSGVSIEHMLNEYEANNARFNRSVQSSVEQSGRDDLATVSNIQREYQNRWENGQATFEQGPSILAPLSSVAGSVVGGYAKWRKLNPVPVKKSTSNAFSKNGKDFSSEG